jgi:hypothetical protein
MIPGRNTDGCVLLSMRLWEIFWISMWKTCVNKGAAHLLGTSRITYPMKKTTNEIEYWYEDKFRSSPIPETFAFPMLDNGVR